MITKKEQYKPTNQYVFLDEKRSAIAQLRKKISKFGIDPNDLGIFTRQRYKIAYEKRTSENNELGHVSQSSIFGTPKNTF